MQYLKEHSLLNTAKVVIINEDKQIPFLIDYLSNSTSNLMNYSIFKYSKLEISNKILNIFECTEVKYEKIIFIFNNIAFI